MDGLTSAVVSEFGGGGPNGTCCARGAYAARGVPVRRGDRGRHIPQARARRALLVGRLRQPLVRKKAQDGVYLK